MKKNQKIIATLLLLSAISQAQIGIGTLVPDTSALLELKSNTKGFLLPRMTSDEQAALSNPAKGLAIFNTTTNQIENNIGDGLGSVLWVGASIKGITAPLGTNTTQLATTEFVLANTGNFSFLEGVNAVTTNSTTEVVVSGMTVTPPAGTYAISFNSQYNNSPIITAVMTTNTSFMTDLVRVYDQLKAIQNPAMAHIATFGTETLKPGVYSIIGASTVTGILTLDALGDPNAIFIIKATGSMTLAATAQIKLINNASAGNVFWLIEGAINVGGGGVTKGIFISNGSAISIGDGTSLEGRIFTTIGSLAFGTGTAIIPELSTTINLGSLSTFVMFTNDGAINNTGASTITGNILSNIGATGSLAIATIIGTIFDPKVGISISTEITNTTLANVTFGIFKEGIAIPNSVRNLKSNSNTASIALQSLVTVNGSQAIDVRWKTDFTKVTLGNRSLTLIKVH